MEFCMKWILDAVISMLNVQEVKELIISLAERLAESTETEIDDKLVELLKRIFLEKKAK